MMAEVLQGIVFGLRQKDTAMHYQTLAYLFIVFGYGAALSLLEPIIENVVHLQTALPPPDTPGIWRKKLIWKARWVQEWKSAKTWKPLWRKVWSPVEIREWVPIPRPPPDFHKPEEEHLPLPDGALPGPPGPPEKYGPPESPPQGLAQFRPIPPNNYGQPSAASAGTSTPLLPVSDSAPPDWPVPDMELLSNYHTIRDPEQSKPKEQQVTPYQVNNPNPERLQVTDFLQPPRQQSEQLYRPPINESAPLQNPRNSVSPYAAKLAQAVLREKFNQSLNPTERPSGLTDVIFKGSASSTTAKTITQTSKPGTGSSSTENPNVYIVTPVSFG